jgi:cysteine desulfurase/selenocysteine lyase
MPPLHRGRIDDPQGLKDLITWATFPKFEGGTPAIGEAIGRRRGALDRRARPAGHPCGGAGLTRATRSNGRGGSRPTIFGPPAGDDRGGIVSFAMVGVHSHDVSEILDRHGVAVRTGHHCAQVLMERLGVPATTRAASRSTTRDEVDRLVEALRREPSSSFLRL